MKIRTSITLDEKVKEIAEDLIKESLEVSSLSALFTALVLRENTKRKRGNKNENTK